VVPIIIVQKSKVSHVNQNVPAQKSIGPSPLRGVLLLIVVDVVFFITALHKIEGKEFQSTADVSNQWT